MTRRLRSSRMCSMSGIRPSGSCFLDAWSIRLPTTRAPVTVSASFGMSGPWNVSCSDRLLVRRHRSGLLDRRLLQLDGSAAGGCRSALGVQRLGRGGLLGTGRAAGEPPAAARRSAAVPRAGRPWPGPKGPSRARSSSCRPETSDLRIRIDRPSDLAATGSFAEPKSTMITTATIRIFHGLSNRSPIISVLFGGDEAPPQSGLFTASVHVRPQAQQPQQIACRMRIGDIPAPGAAVTPAAARRRTGRIVPFVRFSAGGRPDRAGLSRARRRTARPSRRRGSGRAGRPAR